MTLISTSAGRCQPGRREDFMALALEGMKLFERHGAHHARLFAGITAGESSNLYMLNNQFDDAEHYGAFVDELYRDAEMESLLARIDAPSSPIVIESRTLANEIPLDRTSPQAHGSVLEVHVLTLTPGRFEDCCELVSRAFDLMERHGATNCRLLQLDSAGELTEKLVVAIEFENMQQRGAAADAWPAEPEGRAVLDVAMGSEPPATRVSSGLYRDLHM